VSAYAIFADPAPLATLATALLVCRVVEKAAKMYLFTGRGARPRPIRKEFVDQERDRFLNKYGKEG